MKWFKTMACEWGLHSTKVKVESRLSGRCRCLWCGKETYPFGMNVAGFMLEEELGLNEPTPTKSKGRSGWGGVSNSFKNWWKSL